MSLELLSFDDLKTKLNYAVISDVNALLRDTKEPGLDDLWWYSIKAQKSPYLIPEVGNFILFDHDITMEEFNDLHATNILNTMMDGVFYGQRAIGIIDKLYNFFNSNNAPLVGVFYFLNLLQLNNEQTFSYNIVIYYMLKELAFYRTKTKKAIYMDHLKFVLDAYYRLMLHPTLQLQLYLMDPKRLTQVHAYHMLLVLSLGDSDEILKFKSFFKQLYSSSDSPNLMLQMAYMLEPGDDIEAIGENYLCVMIAFSEMFKNIDIKHRLIEESFILRLKSGSDTLLELAINKFLKAGKVQNQKKRVKEIQNEIKSLINQHRR